MSTEIETKIFVFDTVPSGIIETAKKKSQFVWVFKKVCFCFFTMKFKHIGSHLCGFKFGAHHILCFTMMCNIELQYRYRRHLFFHSLRMWDEIFVVLEEIIMSMLHLLIIIYLFIRLRTYVCPDYYVYLLG